MPKGPQGQKPFFHVGLWHLLAMALLLGLSVWNLIEHLHLPIPLTGDYILIVASGAMLTLFGWSFYAQRS